ncbi:flagellar hook basal-body protein [uncultured Planktomarina sp.]|jgi:flagellar hook protein FlgE|uniref:flagellar hook-basal body protein n=1 Tax=uncultured Planktomarina sp. TaxID=1538529 RepID=UPI0032602600
MYGIIRSGMSTAMHEIAVVSNNIANSGSTGFKKSDVSFNDIYGSATPDTVSRTQAGFGSTIAGTRRNDGQGAIVDRPGALNLAIIGAGMFTVSPPGSDGTASDAKFYTRSGELTIDKNGYLKTGDGAFVLGTAPGSAVGSDSPRIAMQIPFSDDGSSLTGLEITAGGKISATYGSDIVDKGSLTIATFANQGGLKNVGSSRFSETTYSGSPEFGVAGQTGYGTLQAGALEGSNVDITQEMTVMIRAQQQFSGSARVLQANSDMVEKLTR